MTADTEIIRKQFAQAAAALYALDHPASADFSAALAALGRVEERERAAQHLAERARLFDGPELRRWIGSNQVESVSKPVAQAVALVAGAIDLAVSLAGSVAGEDVGAAEGTGGYSEPGAPGKNAAPSERGSSSAPHAPSGASAAAGSGEE